MHESLDLSSVAAELHRQGLRLTRLKKGVLTALSAQPALSAEELGSRLDLGSDLSALYRCLASLEEAGVVTHLYLDDDSRRYVLQEPFGPHHDYLVCSNCLTVKELDCCVDEAVERQMVRRGFEIRGHQLILRGVCSDCRSES